MKYNYDYAAEMVKIAGSAEHQRVFCLEKVAFSRDGKEIGGKSSVSEVEEEMKKSAKDDKECSCEGECHCSEDDEKEEEGEKKEASDTTLEDTAGLLLEISNELEGQGLDSLAAASIILADNILKTAAAKKKKPSKSKSKSKSKGKKMSMKERMEKMRAAQGKGKKSKDKEEKSSTPESSTPETPKP